MKALAANMLLGISIVKIVYECFSPWKDNWPLMLDFN